MQNDSINVLDFENVYNGGGVGIGDFNNDGLQDIYFTGNLVTNKLYINKGGFSFQDVTTQAAVDGGGRWCRGASVIDINNDGWMDLYVSASIKKNPADRQNLLYINQGAGKEGIPTFKEMAAAYGLNDTSQSTMASFFDYDNDGDLDVYIAVNHIIRGDYPNQYRPRKLLGEH
ncbi:MAG TPA: VCBS repeat-containing protein, partial [Niastella sp.]|nr:VCBS repeat-containing protein [Niastella sp.]